MKPPRADLSARIETALLLANDEAASAGLTFIWPQHLLLALLREPTGSGGRALVRLGLKLREARQMSASLLKVGRDVVVSGRLPLHPFTRRALRRAGEIAAQGGSAEAEDTHVLLALIENPRRPPSRVLEALGVRPQNLRMLLTGTPVAEMEATLPLQYDSRSQRGWFSRWLFRRQ